MCLIRRQTIRDFLTLMAGIFLLEELPPWHGNRLKRLVKTPKLHLGDTGLACAVLGWTADSMWAYRPLFGRLLETFVYQELRRQADWRQGAVAFSHYRDKDQVEVDVVMEAEGRMAGVEVKAGSTVTADDFKGLRKLRDTVGANFAGGVVLYDGPAVVGFGDRLQAVPISQLWAEADRSLPLNGRASAASPRPFPLGLNQQPDQPPPSATGSPPVRALPFPGCHRGSTPRRL
ncbi:MAG: DUF4143 domain-containing protein [Akkermansiaceae bacterium]|nr:DUF4143 domain-containing protein [Akkermansiaceae bacterium]